MTHLVKLVEQQTATVQLIRRVRAKLGRLFSHQKLTQHQQDDLLLAFSEHASNFVKHNEAQVWLSVSFNLQTTTLIIEDNGQSIESMLASSPDVDLFTDNHQLYESGMGLVTIKALFPNYQYQQSAAHPSTNVLMLPIAQSQPMIVVVDDDPVFLTVIEQYLMDQYQVVVFSDPNAALTRLAEGDVAMVICDVKMPVIDGFALREKMLTNAQQVSVPFVFLSGNNNEALQGRASGLEIDDFLVKPINKTALLTTINRVLTRSERLQKQLSVKLDSEVTQGLWAKGPWQVGRVRGELDYCVFERGGGDFLVQLPIQNGKRFVLGDVMGHGTQAKFFAYSLCGFMTGLCATLTSSAPAEHFMSQLSNLISRSELLVSTFVTLLVIDVFDDNRVELVAAGHPPPFLLRDGQWECLALEGALPGLVENIQYQKVCVELHTGDVLLAYTDGLVESVFGLDSHEQAIYDYLQPLSLAVDLPITAQCFSAWNIRSKQVDDDVTLFSLTGG